MKNPDSIKPEEQLGNVIRHIKSSGRYEDNIGAKFLVALYEKDPQAAYAFILRSVDVQTMEFTEPEHALLDQVSRNPIKPRDPIRDLQVSGAVGINRRELVKKAALFGGVVGTFGVVAHGLTEGVEALDLPWHRQLEEWSRQEASENPDWADTTKEYLGAGAKIGLPAALLYFTVNNLLMRFQTTREKGHAANMICGLASECIQVHRAQHSQQTEEASRA